ncbi:MAG: RsmB/NOP family class I SAM-dependent RNA methyltransferase [Planctomycetota bacterium]
MSLSNSERVASRNMGRKSKSAAKSNHRQRLARRLFETPDDQQRFLDSLETNIKFPVALIWIRKKQRNVFLAQSPPEWLPEFAELVSFDQRPGKHPLHDDGKYYCVDPSSIFMMMGAAHLAKADTEIQSVLDVCASPGGKSILAKRWFQPQLLVANEVIGKRLGALISNFKRCKISSAQVTSVDTSKFSELIPQTFDLVLVDAPCSGQSLIPKGKPSPGCFHPATINLNANRQRRILANAAKATAGGGWLIYMTCTYSLKENETNVAWFLKKHPEFKAVECPGLARYQSHLSQVPAYRLLPEANQGAGGFFALFQRTGSEKWDKNRPVKGLPIRWQSEE